MWQKIKDELLAGLSKIEGIEHDVIHSQIVQHLEQAGIGIAVSKLESALPAPLKAVLTGEEAQLAKALMGLLGHVL